MKYPYRLDVLTLFPKAFSLIGEYGVIGKAIESGLAELHTHNPREFANDRYRKVDDQPYGGGPGMVLKPEPFFAAIESIPSRSRRRVVLLSPQGSLLRQKDLQRWSIDHDQLILICGSYEGFDERIRSLADEEISLGDFVLTGGEVPAMSIINGLIRLLPGTLGAPESLVEESHASGLLEHPQYTRPAEFRGMYVPDILRSGDHSAILDWREKQRKIRTEFRRPDLYLNWLNKKSNSNKEVDSSTNFSRNNIVDKEFGIIYPDW